MTTDTIHNAARSGFAVYYAHRSWAFEGNARKCRWEQVAARVLNGEITTARKLRDAYLDGYVIDLAWTDLGVHDRKRWGQ